MKSFVKWYPVIVMATICLCFAISNILLKKIITDGVDHLVFVTYRQSTSAIFLSPLAFFLERKSRPKLKPSVLCHILASAMFGATLPLYLFLLGIEYTSATFACAFNNMVPVLTFLMALPFGYVLYHVLIFISVVTFSAVSNAFPLVLQLRERKDKRISGIAKVVGALVCLGGAILLTSYKGIPLFHFSHSQSDEQHVKKESHILGERWVIGSVLLFAGTVCWSSWFLLQSKIGKRYPCQYSSTAIMVTFSALQSAVLSLSIDRKLSIWLLKSKTNIFIVLYAGMVGSGLCFVGMSWCVKKRGPVFTAAFSPLVQILAGTIDVPVLHEQLHLGSVIGSVTVIAGLYILLWGKDKEMQKQEKSLDEPKSHEPGIQVINIEVESRNPRTQKVALPSQTSSD